MKMVEINGLTVRGLVVRTRNADEAQPSTARIGTLWAEFGQQIAPHLATGALAYGVYHHYESNADGMFDVLAGADAQSPALGDAPELTRVDIVNGPYLVFEVHGAHPQAVIEAWGRIWRYFADPHCLHQRAYTTDFERYQADGQIDICIAVQPS